VRAYEARRWADAARDFRASSVTAPNPRDLWGWANAAANAGHIAEARDAYAQLTARAPGTVGAWDKLGAMALRLGDVATAQRAAREWVRLQPHDPKAAANLAHVDSVAAGATRSR